MEWDRLRIYIYSFLAILTVVLVIIALVLLE